LFVADSDSEWRRWGETEPYFGVLADPRFRMETIADSRAEFFELGRLMVEERLATMERHFGPFGRRRALDFGCGVGRLSIPLAAHFDEVLGLDIAPAMLTEARANADSFGVMNLNLALSDDALRPAGAPFDLVMSCMVLQHIPVPRGMRMIKLLLDQVGQGGMAALQLCTGRPEGMGARLRYWAQCHVPGVHGLFNVARGRKWREPLMQMNPYPLAHVLKLAEISGFDCPLVQTHAEGRFTTAQLLMRRR
jgi:SAM-dependent methyltransferase